MDKCKITVAFYMVRGALVALAYDDSEGGLIREISDYSIFLSSRQQLDHKTCRQIIYNVIRFLQVIRTRVKGGLACDDDALREFRDDDLRCVRSAKTASASERSAKSTVNSRLVAVYDWIWWLQGRGLLAAGTIGPQGSLILSAEPRRLYTYRRRHVGESAMLVREIYPLLYRNIGGASKHAMQFIPSDKQRLQLLRHFHESSYESFVAHRNILMVDIASTVGFRRGSIISLQASQFTQLTVQELSGDYVAIKPPAQKFSYEDYFEIPVALAERIRAYVNDYLRPYCQSRKWRMDSEWLPLFISTRDGARLTDRSATKIVSSGLRAIGVPSGNALHSFRRRFANAELDREIELRRAAGLDLSVETLCVVISQRLGHRSASSLFAYVSKRLSLSAAKLAAGTGE